MRRYEGEFPKRYFKEFLEYLDITEDHFWEVVDSGRKEHRFSDVMEESFRINLLEFL